MTMRSGPLAKIVAFLLHGLRARLTHADAHRSAAPAKYAGLAMHYRPTSPGHYGSSRTP
ncbi:hypothetical protein [Streptomyces sp. NPDC014733]|uniref:hypothetical protein n=1 Tax=Streptomyces sp. NPDC014733 TaxID=3364885 RepID=UPI0036FE4B9D